jgi:hypothetical protein
MKRVATWIALFASSCAIAPARMLPIADGDYVFQHRFAEHPDMPSVALAAAIKGSHITLSNSQPSDVFPSGIIAEGSLMWHARTRQWIIGDSLSDKGATEVGGCSAGPEVVDLQNRIYWTC